MDNMFLASILGPFYLVIGLSLLLYNVSWQKIVADWEKNHYNLVTAGIISLILGLFIIQVHNIWAWNLWLVITLTGWIAFFKGVFLFLAPGSWIRMCLKWKQNKNYLYFAGLVLGIFGAWMSYLVYLA